MFEKEAEEKSVLYVDKLAEERHFEKGTSYTVGLNEGYNDGFQDGAEFGYNKANEWHRIDEGKYPSKEQLGEQFIVAFAFNERIQKYYSFDCAEYVDKGKFRTHTNNDDKVIAWKEIVLPEVKENE